MRYIISSIFLLLLCTSSAFAQPQYSPEVRAERELKWMLDSLDITQKQTEKLRSITLNFQRNMDKANRSASKQAKKKIQTQLMLKKDAAVKAALNNKTKYQRYYKREKEIRRIAEITYKGYRQPL